MVAPSSTCLYRLSLLCSAVQLATPHRQQSLAHEVVLNPFLRPPHGLHCIDGSTSCGPAGLARERT